MSAVSDSEILSPGMMELPDILDIKAAATLAEELLTLRGKALEIDASRVQRLGGQCLQVLLSASMTWKADGNLFTLTRASSDFLEGLGRLGVSITEFNGRERTQ
ncbi:MAG TPA: STAS domain-containing protein [Methylocella sp.]|nr:STAS domain-containing protein [Methylocella sp.]